MSQLYLFDNVVVEPPYLTNIIELCVLEVGKRVLQDRVEKQPVGPNLKGLCVYHNERSPSFYCKPAPNMFICYGCLELGGPLRLIFDHSPHPLEFLFQVTRVDVDDPHGRKSLADAIELEESKFKRQVIDRNYRRFLLDD